MKKIKSYLSGLKIKNIDFDFGDLLSLIALCMIFYGLYIWIPTVAFVVVGLILLYMSSGA